MKAWIAHTGLLILLAVALFIAALAAAQTELQL